MSLFNALAKYPTPEEIMDHEIVFKKATIDLVTDWKKAHFPTWREKNTEEKIASLESLAVTLTQLYGLPCMVDKTTRSYAYVPGQNLITLDSERPSIISTLHEVAHAIYGASELQACRWSIWLFKKTFPAAFQQLQFAESSHLLVKKP